MTKLVSPKEYIAKYEELQSQIEQDKDLSDEEFIEVMEGIADKATSAAEAKREEFEDEPEEEDDEEDEAYYPDDFEG